MRHHNRDSFFPGLRVKIITPEKKIVEGYVLELKTLVGYDPKGIYVVLESGESGNVLEILESDNEKEYNKIKSDFIGNLNGLETDIVEFKETYIFPVSDENTSKPITSDEKDFTRSLTAKAICSFLNANGGTL